MQSQRLALALLLASLCVAPAAAQPATVRVGSWNIEHLDFPQSRFEDAQGIPQKPADLAAHIAAAGIDVLAILEIGDDEAPGRRSPAMDATVAVLNAGGQDWTYELSANKVPGDKTQLTGVAWNRKKVSRVGTSYRFPIAPVAGSSFNHWDRHPCAFKFSAGAGKSDFVVVPLHMKAGKQAANITQRKEEAEGLRNQLAAFKTQFKEDDVILLGDVNVTAAGEAALGVYTGAGFTDLNAAGVTTVPWGTAPFDHIFLSAQPEFAGAAMTRVIHNNDDDRIRLSDHFLVYTDIKVLADDDDDVPFGGDSAPVQPDPKGGEGGTGTVAPTSALTILAALPDPIGTDEGAESVTLGNGAATAVGLQGWRLLDKANNEYKLTGDIPASSSRSIRVRGAFTLNQNGDEIRLVNPAGQTVHKVSYTPAQVKPGKFITFGS